MSRYTILKLCVTVTIFSGIVGGPLLAVGIKYDGGCKVPVCDTRGNETTGYRVYIDGEPTECWTSDRMDSFRCRMSGGPCPGEAKCSGLSKDAASAMFVVGVIGLTACVFFAISSLSAAMGIWACPVE